MNKPYSLRGVGALCLDGNPIGKADYEILINQDDDDGEKLGFGSMQVNDHVIRLIDESAGKFTLKLEKSETVELVLDPQITGNVVKFDINGPIPGH